MKHRHTRKSLKRLNTKALCGTDIQAMLQVELSEALCTATHPVADNVDDEWTFVRDSTYRAAANTLGVMSIETGSTRTISQPPSSWTSSITNTLFQQQNRRKTSWRHPHWHLIDYIIVRQRDVSDVCLTRSFRGPTCWSDHCLIRSKLSIHNSHTSEA